MNAIIPSLYARYFQQVVLSRRQSIITCFCNYSAHVT